jgi:hypothetical protein
MSSALTTTRPNPQFPHPRWFRLLSLLLYLFVIALLLLMLFSAPSDHAPVKRISDGRPTLHRASA